MQWSAGLRLGEQAPDFELLDQDDKIRRLSEFKGRWLVVFFYPKDHTPGCIREACRFADEHAAFRALGAEVLGVSGDTPQSHLSFALACRASYPLLSDPDRVMRDAWKVPHLFGRLSGRSTYVLDPQGVVRFVFDSRAHAESHPLLALRFLQQESTR